METTLGSGNKMVILDAAGFVTIYNSKLGETDKGVWFSNKTFKEDITGLQAIIDNGYVKPADRSFEKIKSIDLRYGNKVILN